MTDRLIVADASKVGMAEFLDAIGFDSPGTATSHSR
jgi:hypothetical protein